VKGVAAAFTGGCCLDLSQESEKKSRNEVRDIVRPNDGIHTTHFVPFDPLDMREGSICTYINEI